MMKPDDQHIAPTFAKHGGIRLALVCVAAGASAALFTTGRAVSLAEPPASAKTPAVTIEGGPDDSGDNYSWTITHAHTSPIVYVEFPHYHATLFFAPDGWSTESTSLVNVHVKDIPGVCTARVKDGCTGILQGRSGTFRMRIHQAGTRQGVEKVLIRFADGSEIHVPGVQLAVPEAISDRFGPLIGLGAIFLLLLVIHAWRRARARRPVDVSSDTAAS